MKKLAPYYCLVLNCPCGGQRATLPLPPKAARLKHRQQRAAALVRWQAQREAQQRQLEQALQLASAPVGGNA